MDSPSVDEYVKQSGRRSKGSREAAPDVSNELFPCAFPPSSAYAIGEVPTDSVLAPSEVKAKWVEMFNQWSVADDNDKPVLINSVLVYFIKNGASQRARFNKDFVVNGNRYNSRVVYTVLGGDVRRFARAHADHCRELLRNRNDIAAERCKALGMNYEYRDLAFDFADKCTGLKPEELHAISCAKHAVLGTATPFRENDAVTASRSLPSTGNSGGALPAPGPLGSSRGISDL